MFLVQHARITSKTIKKGEHTISASVDRLSLMLLMEPSATSTADWSSSIALQQAGESSVTYTVKRINK
jgi:hypothetical protein